MCNLCKNGAENRKERSIRHTPIKKAKKLYTYPQSDIGKILRQGTPKEGISWEEIVLHYLDYIAQFIYKQEKK